MNIEPKKVWVVGHKNPDTDSICAAISYAYLKNQLGERQYVPKRAGAISEETRYVLDYFKVEDPELITDVGHSSRIFPSAKQPASVRRFL